MHPSVCSLDKTETYDLVWLRLFGEALFHDNQQAAGKEPRFCAEE